MIPASKSDVRAFAELCKREPLLASLKNEAVQMFTRPGKRFCANQVWYSQFKPRLELLVGWYCHNNDDAVKSSEAYSLATDVIYSALPDCVDCGRCM